MNKLPCIANGALHVQVVKVDLLLTLKWRRYPGGPSVITGAFKSRGEGGSEVDTAEAVGEARSGRRGRCPVVGLKIQGP